MDEKLLQKLSLICTILGIIMIFIVSRTIYSGEVSLSEVTDELVDSEVRVTGMMTGVEDKGSLWIFNLENEGEEAKVVYFKGGGSYINKAEYGEDDFVEGREVEIRGRVQEWNGMIEIVAEEIL